MVWRDARCRVRLARENWIAETSGKKHRRHLPLAAVRRLETKALG
jgi:hypothetical protein